MKDARQVAAEALLKTERRAAWSNLSLDGALRRHALSPEDAAFVGVLFYGVVERRLTLDACIAPHCRQALGRLSPQVLCALRTGVYQLLYMDIPDHAAVDESVELVRKLKMPRAAGLVNGVLRSFLRGGKAVPLPGEPVSARLSVEYSCPQPLVKLLLDIRGEEDARRFLSDSLGRPPVAARVNTLRTNAAELADMLEREGVTASPHSHLPDCLLLENTRAVGALTAYRQGLFHVQDVSSQLCVAALEIRPGMRLLDACAAPGGKTFTMAQLLEGSGEVVACDLHQKRADLIANRASEMGLRNITALCHDMSVPHQELGLFDVILCDVPCSGYGVIRRKPEIKYKSPDEFTNIPNLQYNIMEMSSQYCKAGGTLLYSTCTFNPAENEDVLNRFMREHPEFYPRPLGGLLGEDSSRTLLGEYGGDGFYLAALRKGAG